MSARKKAKRPSVVELLLEMTNALYEITQDYSTIELALEGGDATDDVACTMVRVNARLRATMKTLEAAIVAAKAVTS